MAKSKSGGTRSYIRGRVGADVYSIGKDGNGNKQQVIRSLAETVKNPQTQSQMFGRMIMSTVMQAKSALRNIIDHSFDGVPTGQPSISEFVKRNYALIAADAKEHPSADNQFGLVKYGEKGARLGGYVVSSGSLPAMTGTMLDASITVGQGKVDFLAPNTITTFGGLKEWLGLNGGDFFTVVGLVDGSSSPFILRAHISNTLADNTELSTATLASAFTFTGEGYDKVEITMDEDSKQISINVEGNQAASSAVIASKHVNGQWLHSPETLIHKVYPQYSATVVLPTYPTGQEMFLNGGSL